MPTYSVTAPNGKTLDITGDHVPTEAELHDIFAKAGVDTKPPAPPPAAPRVDRYGGLPELMGPQSRAAATEPLVHPTGIHAIDSMTAPVNLAVLGANIPRAVGAAGLSMAGRAAAGVTAAAESAAPVLKYEATKAALEHMGIPAPLAIAAAMAVSGYRKGAKSVPAPTEPTPSPAPPVPQPMSAITGRTNTGSQAPIIQLRQAAAQGMPAPVEVPVEAPASPPAPRGLSPQQAANEAAIAARRAAYQASQQQPAGPAAAPVEAPAAASAPAVAAPVKLSAEETALGLQLMQKGATAPQALEKILALRALRQSGSFAPLPSNREAVARRFVRDATGRWPK